MVGNDGRSNSEPLALASDRGGNNNSILTYALDYIRAESSRERAELSENVIFLKKLE